MKKNGWPIFDKKDILIIQNAVKKSISSSSEGKNVGFTKKFEKNFAKFHKRKYGVACFNCTVGLEALLICSGIGPGDEVLVPAFTYTSSVTSILRVGALPIFVDINKETLCVDVDILKKNLTKKTKAILLVHFGGFMEDPIKIKKLAKKWRIKIIEDAAQSHGSKRNNQYPGGIDAGAIFSFQRNKNMSSGEGGILLTDSKKIAKKFREFIWHGTKPNNSSTHHFTGTNFRITEFQSALLINQLKKLNKWNKIRMSECKKLDKYLSKIKNILTNNQSKMSIHARHLYSFRVKNEKRLRFKIINKLNKKGIRTSPGYKYPIYKSPIFVNRNFPKYFIKSNQGVYKKWLKRIDKIYLKNSEEVCNENIILAHFNFLNKNSSQKIINVFKTILNEKS